MSGRAKYMVKVHGCDDITYVSCDLTAREADLVRTIAGKVTTGGGGCKPTMTLVPWDETDEYEREECDGEDVSPGEVTP